MLHVYGHEMVSDSRAHWRYFARARFTRIYPLFAATTLVTLTIVATSPTRLSLVSFSVTSLSLQPLLLQQWSGLSWNYPSWSISTEAYVYFNFAAALSFKEKYPWLFASGGVPIVAASCVANGACLNLFR